MKKNGNTPDIFPESEYGKFSITIVIDLIFEVFDYIGFISHVSAAGFNCMFFILKQAIIFVI